MSNETFFSIGLNISIKVSYTNNVLKNNNPSEYGFLYTNFNYCDENLKKIHIGFCKAINDGETNLEKNCVSQLRIFHKYTYYKTRGYIENDLFKKGDTGLQKTFNQFYFSTRSQTYCYKSSRYYGTLLTKDDIQFNKANAKLTLTKDFTSKEHKRFNCDNTNDIKLKKLIDKQQNFALETMGTSFPDWLVNIKKLANYQIIFAIPGVNTCKLLTRNKTRAITTLKNFLQDPDNTEPPVGAVHK